MFDSTALSSGDVVDIQSVELFEMNTQSSRSTLYISDIANPEAFTNPEGIRGISVDDGQSVRDCFVLRDNLRSGEGPLILLHLRPVWRRLVDGLPELVARHARKRQRGWCVRPVDLRRRRIRSDLLPVGIYRWDGGIPEKISDEIEPTTARIDWYVAQRFAWITVDADKQIVYPESPAATSITTRSTWRATTTPAGLKASVNGPACTCRSGPRNLLLRDPEPVVLPVQRRVVCRGALQRVPLRRRDDHGERHLRL